VENPPINVENPTPNHGLCPGKSPNFLENPIPRHWCHARESEIRVDDLLLILGDLGIEAHQDLDLGWFLLVFIGCKGCNWKMDQHDILTHDGSMVLLYMVCHGSHQYTPFMLAIIYTSTMDDILIFQLEHGYLELSNADGFHPERIRTVLVRTVFFVVGCWILEEDCWETRRHLLTGIAGESLGGKHLCYLGLSAFLQLGK
jgi:hypothetical protein